MAWTTWLVILSAVAVGFTKADHNDIWFKQSLSDFNPLSISDCNYTPEIMFLIATSGPPDGVFVPSFPRDLVKYVYPIIDDLRDRFGGFVRIGIASYRDKPIPPFGEQGDYCARIEVPLPGIGKMTDFKKLRSVLSSLEQAGGGDWMDATFDAIARIALSDLSGWSSIGLDPLTGKPVRRLIIVLTEAISHVGHTTLSEKMFRRLSLLNKQAVAKDVNNLCGTTYELIDYTPITELTGILNARNISTVMLNWAKDPEADATSLSRSVLQTTGVPREVVQLIHQEVGTEEIEYDLVTSPERVTNFYKHMFNRVIKVPFAYHVFNESHPLMPPPGRAIIKMMDKRFASTACYSDDRPKREIGNDEDYDYNYQRPLKPAEPARETSTPFLVAGGVGALVAVAGIGVAVARRFGAPITFSKFLGSGDVETDPSDPVHSGSSMTVEPEDDREQYQTVTRDLFN